MVKIPVVENILSANERIAAENERTLDDSGVLAVNIMSSPGAGKTSLIGSTIMALTNHTRVGVIEGDVASRIDADYIESLGVPVVQINTGSACHLDANMVQLALAQLPLHDLDLLFIENVGNLICPTAFALGERLKVMISSVPEGDDKPYKYPAMFAAVDGVVVNKIDLLPHLEFGMEGFRNLIEGLNPGVQFFQISCKNGEGIQGWLDWLLSKLTMEPLRTTV